jgi:hypothetical protein
MVWPLVLMLTAFGGASIVQAGMWSAEGVDPAFREWQACLRSAAGFSSDAPDRRFLRASQQCRSLEARLEAALGRHASPPEVERLMLEEKEYLVTKLAVLRARGSRGGEAGTRDTSQPAAASQPSSGRTGASALIVGQWSPTACSNPWASAGKWLFEPSGRVRMGIGHLSERVGRWSIDGRSLVIREGQITLRATLSPDGEYLNFHQYSGFDRLARCPAPTGVAGASPEWLRVAASGAAAYFVDTKSIVRAGTAVRYTVAARLSSPMGTRPQFDEAVTVEDANCSTMTFQPRARTLFLRGRIVTASHVPADGQRVAAAGTLQHHVIRAVCELTNNRG